MGYNVYFVSHAVQDMSKFALTVCDMLRSKVQTNCIRVWALHLGDVESWGSYDFDVDDFERQFSAKFGSDAFPQVTCMHMENCADVAVAADMCNTVIKSYEGPCAVFFDMDENVARVVEVSDAMLRLIESDGRTAQNLIFCSYSQMCDEVAMDSGTVAGEVADDSIKCRLWRALGVD